MTTHQCCCIHPAACGHSIAHCPGKVELPCINDDVSKLKHMGKETVKKLRNLAESARQAGLDLPADVPVQRVTKGTRTVVVVMDVAVVMISVVAVVVISVVAVVVHQCDHSMTGYAFVLYRNTVFSVHGGTQSCWAYCTISTPVR